MRWIILALLPILAYTVGTQAHSQSRDLQGLWRGIGFVKPADGQREKIHCRVTFNRQSAVAYDVTAKCAGQSASITQTGRVRRTGANRYAGNFYNSDYNVYGRIQIRVHGSRQSVSFRSEAGFGSVQLFKR